MKKKPPARRSPKYILEKPIGIRLKPDEKMLVETYASYEYLSRAAFLRRIVLLGVEQYEQERTDNPSTARTPLCTK